MANFNAIADDSGTAEDARTMGVGVDGLDTVLRVQFLRKLSASPCETETKPPLALYMLAVTKGL